MTKLNEKEVLARSHATCLANVRKLICWGNNLTDISIVQEMVNLEVLNLSVNNITTLKPLSHCPRLKEIYIRKNQIRNFDEVAYLKNLPQLNILWMSDNPISNSPKYRKTILRNLPGLVKLDSVDVKNDEKSSAFQEGELIESNEVLPDYNGLDLNHTLTTEAVLQQTKMNRDNKPIKNDEKPESNVCIDDFNKSVEPHQKRFETNESSSKMVQCNRSISTEEKGMLTDSTDLHNYKSTSKQHSNTFNAIILLLNDLEHTDLLEVHKHTQNLLKSYTESSNVSAELLED